MESQGESEDTERYVQTKKNIKPQKKTLMIYLTKDSDEKS